MYILFRCTSAGLGWTEARAEIIDGIRSLSLPCIYCSGARLLVLEMTLVSWPVTERTQCFTGHHHRSEINVCSEINQSSMFRDQTKCRLYVCSEINQSSTFIDQSECRLYACSKINQRVNCMCLEITRFPCHQMNWDTIMLAFPRKPTAYNFISLPASKKSGAANGFNVQPFSAEIKF
jgi:hypothetical protein